MSITTTIQRFPFDGRWEEYDPAAKDMNSFDQIGAQFSETWLGKAAKGVHDFGVSQEKIVSEWNKQERNVEPLQAVQELDTELELREHEMRYLIDEGVRDPDKARAIVMRERASEERQRQLAQQSEVSNLLTGLVAYIPQGVIEVGVSGGFGAALNAVRAPIALTNVVTRDIAAAYTVELAGAGYAAYIDPVDGIEEGIQNGLVNGTMSAAALLGFEAARVGYGGVKQAMTPKIGGLVDEVKTGTPLAAAFDGAADVPMGTPVVDINFSEVRDEILASRGIATDTETIRSFTGGKMSDRQAEGTIRLVEPAAEDATDGLHFVVVERFADEADIPPAPRGETAAETTAREAKAAEWKLQEEAEVAAHAEQMKAFEVEEATYQQRIQELEAQRAEAAAMRQQADEQAAQLKAAKKELKQVEKQIAKETDRDAKEALRRRETDLDAIVQELSGKPKAARSRAARLEKKVEAVGEIPQPTRPPERAPRPIPEDAAPPAPYVAPRATGEGEKVFSVFQRTGYQGAWEKVGTHASQGEAITAVKAEHPMAAGVENFLHPTTYGWTKSKLLDVQEQYVPGGRSPVDAANVVARRMEKELELLEESIAALKARRATETNPALIRESTLQIEARETRLENMRDRVDRLHRTGNVRGAAFGQGNVWTNMLKMLDKGSKLVGKDLDGWRKKNWPYWNLISNEKLANTQVGIDYANLAEDLMGTQGVSLFAHRAGRRGRESVHARIQSRMNAHFSRHYDKLLEAYSKSIGMQGTMSPYGAFVRSVGTRAQRLYKKVADKIGATPADRPITRTFEEFDAAVRDAHIDKIQALEGGNGAWTSGDKAIDEAVEAYQQLYTEVGEMVRSVGGFGTQSQLKADIEQLKRMIAEPSWEDLEPVALKEGEDLFTPRQRELYVTAMNNAQATGNVEGWRPLTDVEFHEAQKDHYFLVNTLATKLDIPVTYLKPSQLHMVPDRVLEGLGPYAKGFYFMSEGRGYIVNLGVSRDRVHSVHATLHEFSHAIDAFFWQSARPEVKNALIEAYQAYRSKFHDKMSDEELLALRTEMGGPAALYTQGRRPLEPGGREREPSSEVAYGVPNKEWVMHEMEWRAEQIARWLKTNETPHGLVEQHFADVAGYYKLMEQELGRSNIVPHQAVQRWMDDVWFNPGRVAALSLQWIDNDSGPLLEEKQPKLVPRSDLLIARHEKLRRLQMQYDKYTVGALKSHYHKSYDKTAIIQNTDGFQDLAKAYFVQSGMTEAGAEEAAKKVTSSILDEGLEPGATPREKVALPVAMEVTGGHLGAETFSMPAWFEAGGLRARDFLRTDHAQVAHEYLREAYGVTEMSRVFGDHNGETRLRELRRAARRENVPEELIGEMEEAFRTLRNDVLGKSRIVDDPSLLSTRVLRTTRHFNVAAYMGKVVQMQAVDLAALVQISGFRNLLNAMELNWGKAASEAGRNVPKEMTDLFGLAVEVASQQRIDSLTNELGHSIGYKTKAEQLAAKVSRNIFQYGGATVFTDHARRIGGILTSDQLLRYCEAAKNGTLKPQTIHPKTGKMTDIGDEQRLRAFGLDQKQAAAIYDEWAAHVPESERAFEGMTGGKLYIADASSWTDLELQRKFTSAVRTNMDSLVLTPNAATRPQLLQKEAMRWLLLYQSFGIHAAQTLSMRMADGTLDMQRTALLAASLIGATALVQQFRKPDYVEDDWNDVLYEATLMSGVLSIPGMVAEYGSSITGMHPLGFMGFEQPSFKDDLNPAAAFGPVASQWEGLVSGIGNRLTGEKDSGDDMARGLRYMVPYNNLWYLNGVANWMRSGAGEILEPAKE